MNMESGKQTNPWILILKSLIRYLNVCMTNGYILKLHEDFEFIWRSG